MSAQSCVLAGRQAGGTDRGSQRCSAARWDSVASRLSLLPGIICLTLPPNGKDRSYSFAQLHRMNVSRNATEKSCLWGEIFMVRDGFVGVASC